MNKNPSTGNGFIKIANELVEVFATTSLSGSEMRIIWVVMRKTWGWIDKKNTNRRKDFDRIALSQFTSATGMKQVNVVRILRELVACKLLLKTDKGYGINQDYSEWVVVKRLLRVASSLQTTTSSLQATGASSLQTTESSSLQTTYKRKKESIKETKQKKGEEKPAPRDDTKKFFEGVRDLLEKKPVPWLSEMLAKLAESNPGVDKRKIWDEVVSFCGYWTEREQGGRGERWQLQKTFEVWLRLVTWFKRANFKDFQGSGQSRSKGRGLVE